MSKMVNFKSIYVVQIFIIFLINFTSGLYEDQIGKFDWKRSFIGKVKYAKFDVKRLLVVSEENVLASLNIKNGNILWRHLLENSKAHEVKYLHLGKDVITISGGFNNWYIRSWDINSGTLLSEWVLLTENAINPIFWIIGNKLIYLAPILGSHIEISKYGLQSGDLIEKSEVLTPWMHKTSDCLYVKNYFVCLLKNVLPGTLYYMDVLSKSVVIHSKDISDLIDDMSGEIDILNFENSVPSFLLVHDNTANLIDIENFNIKPYTLMTNAISLLQDNSISIFQLELSSTPNKIIKVEKKNYINGEIEFETDLDYPTGLGAPIILAGHSKGVITDLLLTTTDEALLVVRLPEGKILWIREEALSNIVALEFVELPVSELDASIEKEFKTSSSNILKMLLHRLTTQFTQLSNLIFGSQLSVNQGLIRDNFGLHKIIIAVTNAGKLFALDTLTGSILWSYRLPNVKSFDLKTNNNQKVILFVQRTARYAPLPAQCMVLVEDSITGNAVSFQFDPLSGYSQDGIQRVNYKIAQAMLMPFEDDNNLKPILIISSSYQTYTYPRSSQSIIYKYRSKIFISLIDHTLGVLKGFSLHDSDMNNLRLTPTWNINLYPSKLVGIATKPPNERVHSQGRVLPDRSVYYKYVNPNLIAIATLSEDPVHKHVLSIYLVDGVTGLILYSVLHKRARGPVHLVHSENWLVYSYYSERFRRTELVAAELYEGYMQSNSTVFSSYAVSLLPLIQTQAYILPANLLKMEVTLTERGITNKFLLLGMSNGAVIEIPWLLVQPRFNDIPCGPEESCIPYMPEIPLPSEACINYNQTISQINGIQVAPARLESTSHVLVHGLDIFYTRVAPSKTFDLLKEDFDYLMIILVLSGLVVASYVTKYLASKKALRLLWK